MIKSNLPIKIILLLLLFLFFLSCSNSCNVSGINVSELLSVASKEKGINYCSLLKKAIKEDELAIRELSLLKFNDATGYDQGAVIIDLILELGENKYISSISEISNKEKILIESYIDIGFEYSEKPELKNKKPKNFFPKLYVFLKE